MPDVPPARPRGDAPRRLPLRSPTTDDPGASRAYARPLVEPVTLSTPAELRLLDALADDELPADVWIVEAVEQAPRFDRPFAGPTS